MKQRQAFLARMPPARHSVPRHSVHGDKAFFRDRKFLAA
jgi:hypothetical protein